MNGRDMRSPLARARGLGSAREGVAAWWFERVTAVALVPLTLWFATSLLALAGADYATVAAWLKRPLTALLMVLQLTALFSHLALGLRVIIEDYIHSGVKIPALMAVRFGCFALAVTGILATLRIALTG